MRALPVDVHRMLDALSETDADMPSELAREIRKTVGGRMRRWRLAASTFTSLVLCSTAVFVVGMLFLRKPGHDVLWITMLAGVFTSVVGMVVSQRRHDNAEKLFTKWVIITGRLREKEESP